MKKFLAVSKALLASCLLSISVSAALTGCKMARPDSKAVRLDLVFSDPRSFPFIKIYKMRKETQDGFASVRIKSSTPKEEITKLLKEGYREEYFVFARIYLYTLNTESKQWEPINQYFIHYAWLQGKWWIGQGFLYPVKREWWNLNTALLRQAVPGEPYASTKFTMAILDYDKQFSFRMKIVAVPNDSSVKTRYWITDITREDLKIWTEDHLEKPKLFDWRLSMPEAKITLPPWDKWHLEQNPPVAEPVPPAQDVFIIIRERDNSSEVSLIKNDR